MGRAWVSAILVCIAMVGAAAAPAPVAAQDDWPDSCNSGVKPVDPGTYTGTLSPNDMDFLRIEMEKGDYISYTLEIDAPSSDQKFTIFTRGGSNTQADGTELKADPGHDPTVTSVEDAASRFQMTPGEVNHRAYLESDRNRLCVMLNSNDHGTGEWRFAFVINDTTPPDIGAGDRDAAELEQELEEKEETISEQQETIQEQEERIAELEAQINAAEDGQDVTINVEVQPGNENQAYIDGGTAVVTADSEEADLSALTVGYQNEDYRLMDGELELTLQGRGMQELQFQYGDTTETAMINVQEPESASTTDTPEQDDETSPPTGEDKETPAGEEESSADEDDKPVAADEDAPTDEEEDSASSGEESLPGFGIAVTLLALFLLGSLFIYRRRDR